MRALVIDDLAMTRRLIKNNLMSIGFKEVFEAGDGAQALKLLKTEKEEVHLIITDWLMPKLDGIEFVKILKSRPELKKIPVLMITCLGEKQDVLKAFQNGVNDYMSKPFTSETLQKKVEVLIKNSEDYLVK